MSNNPHMVNEPPKLSLKNPAQLALVIGFFQALVAILGSLYFSEVEGFAPCLMCWLQRVAIYPQVIIYGVGLWYNDTKVYLYTLPLTIFGLIVSLWQNYEYFTVNYWNPSAEFAPCSTTGPSCTTTYLKILGFIDIPLMSLAALFVLLAVGIVLQRHNAKK